MDHQLVHKALGLVAPAAFAGELDVDLGGDGAQLHHRCALFVGSHSKLQGRVDGNKGGHDHTKHPVDQRGHAGKSEAADNSTKHKLGQGDDPLPTVQRQSLGFKLGRVFGRRIPPLHHKLLGPRGPVVHVGWPARGGM